MIVLILIILFLTICLYFIYKDWLKILKITSIVTISSGILTFTIGYLVKYFMNKNLNFINISDVIDIIASKFVLNSIYLLILGLIEFTCYFIIYYNLTNKRKVIS